MQLQLHMILLQGPFTNYVGHFSYIFYHHITFVNHLTIRIHTLIVVGTIGKTSFPQLTHYHAHIICECPQIILNNILNCQNTPILLSMTSWHNGSMHARLLNVIILLNFGSIPAIAATIFFRPYFAPHFLLWIDRVPHMAHKWPHYRAPSIEHEKPSAFFRSSC